LNKIDTCLSIFIFVQKCIYKKNEADISYDINKANVTKMINREKSIQSNL